MFLEPGHARELDEIYLPLEQEDITGMRLLAQRLWRVHAGARKRARGSKRQISAYVFAIGL